MPNHFIATFDTRDDDLKVTVTRRNRDTDESRVVLQSNTKEDLTRTVGASLVDPKVDHNSYTDSPIHSLAVALQDMPRVLDPAPNLIAEHDSVRLRGLSAMGISTPEDHFSFHSPVFLVDDSNGRATVVNADNEGVAFIAPPGCDHDSLGTIETPGYFEGRSLFEPPSMGNLNALRDELSERGIVPDYALLTNSEDIFNGAQNEFRDNVSATLETARNLSMVRLLSERMDEANVDVSKDNHGLITLTAYDYEGEIYDEVTLNARESTNLQDKAYKLIDPLTIEPGFDEQALTDDLVLEAAATQYLNHVETVSDEPTTGPSMG